MLDFYFFAWQKLILFFLAALFLFVVQAAYCGQIIFNNLLKRKWHLLGELLLLLYFAQLALLPITALLNRRFGIIDTTFLGNGLYTLAIIFFIYALIMYIKKLNSLPLALSAIIISLPYETLLPYGFYQFNYALALAIFIIRSFRHLYSEDYAQKHELSAYSVKEGLDTLPAGIMFCDNDGYIYLINSKMEELIKRFWGADQKDGNYFWQNLQQGRVNNAICHFIEDDIILRTTDDAWRFSRHIFNDIHFSYMEIIAININQTMQALQQLDRDREALMAQSKDLLILSQKMENLRKEQEYSRIRNHIHDIMSQRLTTMQRILQSQNPADKDDMLPLLEDMLAHLTDREAGDANQLLLGLSNYFERAGLAIKLDGDLPTDDAAAFLLVSVLREASTNALRHAGATLIKAKIENNGAKYIIEITNNGHAPTKGIVEGGGLSGIRNRVENVGGRLRVELMPEFALIIEVPKTKAAAQIS